MHGPGSAHVLDYCKNCSIPLAGEYCHQCGQRRVDGKLTLGSFFADVARRVFRFDKAFAVTLWRMLVAPGRLVPDYLEGKRAGYLDPIQYFISSVFVQFVVTATTQDLAPILGRESAIAWLGQLTGVVAVKVLTIFWMGTLWRFMFRPTRYNLAEIYVFALYAFGTTGLLWSVLPLVDIAVPYPLGANAIVVTAVTLVVEIAYMTYAIWQFGKIPFWNCAMRVTAVLAVGYLLLVAIVGVEHVAHFLLPTVKLTATPTT